MLSACKFECAIVGDLQEDLLEESFPDKGGESEAGFKQNRGESLRGDRTTVSFGKLETPQVDDLLPAVTAVPDVPVTAIGTEVE